MAEHQDLQQTAPQQPGPAAITTAGGHGLSPTGHVTPPSQTRDLQHEVHEHHKRHSLRLDASLNEKSPEELVCYLVEMRGFEEEVARDIVKLYPPESLSKVVKFPKGLPTIGERRAQYYEGFE